MSLAVMNPMHGISRNGWATKKFLIRRLSPKPIPVLHYIGKSRYLPHSGAKEAARHAGKVTLGPNASRMMPRVSIKDKLRAAGNGMSKSMTELGEAFDKFGKAVAEIAHLTDSEFEGDIGEQVEWTSSGLTKTGEIVAIVLAGNTVPTDLTPKIKDPGGARDHDSYVVKANGKHYWPRVSLLKWV